MSSSVCDSIFTVNAVDQEELPAEGTHVSVRLG